jgi:hypothetical protein
MALHDRGFLPPGRRLLAMECLALAEEAVKHAEANPECTKHVYRSQHPRMNEEVWLVRRATDGEWKMHVDCAGFVRNVLETTLKKPFTAALSDRSFMRAKDFCYFFEHLPSLCVGKDDGSNDRSASSCWRRIDDLRTILPGDIIAYRHKGHAAAGSTFMETTSVYNLFKALKVKQIFDAEAKIQRDGMVHRNIAEDEAVRQWADSMVHTLAEIGIESLTSLRERIEDDDVKNLLLCNKVEISILKEAMQSKAHDTGHVMFAAGLAEKVEENKWRVPVYQSTASSVQHRGVQHGYRTFTLSERGQWLWEGDTSILGVPDEVFAGRFPL